LLGDKGDPAFASKLKNSIKPAIMKALEYKPNIDKRELDYILEYPQSAMVGVMSYWFRQEEAPSRDDLFRLIYKMMEDGIMKHLPLQTRGQGLVCPRNGESDDGYVSVYGECRSDNSDDAEWFE